MIVMLKDWMKLLGNCIFQVFNLNDWVSRFEHSLEEHVEAIAKTEIVAHRLNLLIFGIFLSQVMIPHLGDWCEALHEGIQIAIVAVILYSNYSITKVL